MQTKDRRFEVRLASGAADIRAAQRLRYEVFVEELGADGPSVDHADRIETDDFDRYCEHLLLIDRNAAAPRVAGVYRMMTDTHAAQAGRFYSESEFDLTPLREDGRSLLELGRSCVHRDYRGGTSMYYLWNALAAYVLNNGIEILFGVASFHGTDPHAIAQPLSYLDAHHLAPEDLRVRSRVHQPMDLVPPAQVDRLQAMRDTPALIKAYLRLGGFVGDGAYVDHDFNTIDVCLVMDTVRMSARSRDIYTRKARR